MAFGELIPARSARAFGEPRVTEDGATIIPVSRRRDGRDDGDALGVFVVSGGEVVWSPVVDADRIALIGVATGFVAATLACLAVLRRPPWQDVRLVSGWRTPSAGPR